MRRGFKVLLVVTAGCWLLAIAVTVTLGRWWQLIPAVAGLVLLALAWRVVREADQVAAETEQLRRDIDQLRQQRNGGT